MRGTSIAEHSFNEHTTTVPHQHEHEHEHEHNFTRPRPHTSTRPRFRTNTASDQHNLGRTGLRMSAASYERGFTRAQFRTNTSIITVPHEHTTTVSHEHTTTASHEQAFEAKDQEEQIDCFRCAQNRGSYDEYVP